MEHCGTKVLETERLILRRFTIEDAPAMYCNWASDLEVTKYLTWPAHKSIDVTTKILKEWINSYSKKDYYQWAITLKNESVGPIGCIGVVDKNDKVSMAHIGYCIGRKWWKQGITSEALKAVIDFLFDEVKTNRIEARHDPRNPNSELVMQKCGMIYEGTMRASDWNNQGICDACYYSILKEDVK